MGVLLWISANWFELLQTFGIIAGLLFTAFTVRKDERAREIANLVAIKQQYNDLWKAFYAQPQLFRVLKADVDLHEQPITDEEGLFTKLLLLHLDTVRRAKGAGMFVEIQGLGKDIREFLALPIPKAIWNRLKPFQDEGFVEFVETTLK